ncbi:hypothetical protein ACMXYQ_15990 [Neptuniibacter sp. PT34_22]|uniref:hypothetical protein n=1 Tax=Neptuniibacter sp. PT34_22 TaxID=3398205 RepID=UPI0039F5BB54
MKNLIRKSLWLDPTTWQSLLDEATRRNSKPSITLEALINEAIDSRMRAEHKYDHQPSN